MSAPDFAKEPWKHPAAWKSHLVRRTRDYPPCGTWVTVATCECGWAACAKVVFGGAGERAVDAAVEDHWRDVIAQAEASAA
jgi:hypothetical protein